MESGCRLQSELREVLGIGIHSRGSGPLYPPIVQVYAKLYVMQGVFGIIEGQSEEACISSQRFKNATIRFFGKSIHHFTTFEMSLVYYKDNDIVVEKGDYIHV